MSSPCSLFPALLFLALLSLLVARASAVCDAGMMLDPNFNPHIIGDSTFKWKYDRSHSDEFDSPGEVGVLKWSQKLGPWTGTI